MPPEGKAAYENGMCTGAASGDLVDVQLHGDGRPGGTDTTQASVPRAGQFNLWVVPLFALPFGGK